MPSTLPQKVFRFYPEDLDRIARIREHLDAQPSGQRSTDVSALRYALAVCEQQIKGAKPRRKAGDDH